MVSNKAEVSGTGEGKVKPEAEIDITDDITLSVEADHDLQGKEDKVVAKINFKF